MSREDVLEIPVGARQDIAGFWHRVNTAPCEECGCPYDYSLDEVGVIWEAGENVEEDCLDATCDCHITPVAGLRFRLNFKERFTA